MVRSTSCGIEQVSDSGVDREISAEMTAYLGLEIAVSDALLVKNTAGV